MSDNRVLILDTDPRICRLISRMARDLGFETRHIDKSGQFIDTYQRSKPTVILLDIDLEAPQVNAIYLLNYLSTHYCRAAIFMMTCTNISNLSKFEEIGKSLDLNMAGSLIKPIVLDQCKDKLKKYFIDSNSAEIQSNTTAEYTLFEKHI